MTDFPDIPDYVEEFMQFLREVAERLEGEPLEAAIVEKLTEMFTEVEIVTGWKLGVNVPDDEAFPELAKESEEECEGLDTKLLM